MIKDIFSYKSFIPENAKNDGRVWCFQTPSVLNPALAMSLSKDIEIFCQSWTYHNQPVIGFAKIFYGQFLVFYAEDVSGCGIDKLFHFLKTISEQHQLALLNRTLQAFYFKEKIEIIPLSQVEHAVKNNFITPETLYIDNSISTLEELKEKWIIPFSESWLGKEFYNPIVNQ